MSWCLFIHLNAERHGSRFAWFLTFLVLAAVVGVGLAGYIFYKYRLRVCLKMLLWSALYPSLVNLCTKLGTLPLLKFFTCTCSLTWTRRSWLSCPNTCLWTVSKPIKSIPPRQNLYDMAQHKVTKSLTLWAVFLPVSMLSTMVSKKCCCYMQKHKL